MPRKAFRSPWLVREAEVTPEPVYLNRRALIRSALAAGGGMIVAGASCVSGGAPEKSGGDSPFLTTLAPTATSALYPAPRNKAFKLDRTITEEKVAAGHNNFYEFTTDKSGVWKLAERMALRPWTVEIAGLVKSPKTWDIDALVKRLTLEERLYRHRCVETWAMAVPWTGFPFRAFLDLAEPLSAAQYIHMTSFMAPEVMPGLKENPSFPWPYQEGLAIKEAANDLAFLATGLYGHELPKQHGGPIRLVAPWKYGFKSIKSIVRFEFTAAMPKTFWTTLAPDEYGFWANINPQVSHRRWSQENDRMIGTGETKPTKLFNGYGESVAALYQGMEKVFY